MKSIRSITIALLLLTLLLSACSYTGKNSTSAQATLSSGDILYSDNFTEDTSGWGTMGRTGGAIAFEYEGLTIQVDYPNFMFWTVSSGIYSDARIDVDAVLLDGPADDNFGVICRFQDNDNFYGIVISHDGYFGIFKMLEGTLTLATSRSNLDYSDAIHKGGVVNHISAVCQDDMISLSVNDTMLAQVQDSTFEKGRIGLIAGAYETGGVKVLFDNLEITVP